MITKELKDRILSVVEEGQIKAIDCKAISEEFGLTLRELNWKLEKLGIEKIRTGYIEKFPRDQRVLAYICGLIAADGNLREDGAIRIRLQEGDKEILEWVASKLLVEKPVDIVKPVKGDPNPQVGLCLYLPKLFQFCTSIGIVPNKTHGLDVPLESKSKEFQINFLRGFIDGDGCVSSNFISIGCASEKFIATLNSMFGGTVYSRVLKNNTLFHSITFYPLLARKLAFELLNDSVMIPGISRKREKLQRCLLTPPKTRDQTRTSVMDGSYWNQPTMPSLKPLWEKSDKIVDYWTFRARVTQAGMSIEDALNTPPYKVARRGGKGWGPKPKSELSL